MPSKSPLHTIIQCLAVAAGGFVLVLSWLPDSRLGELPFFPSGFGAWLDQGGAVATMRTGLAMAVAAALIHAARWVESPWKSGGVAGALLLTAEGGQLLLPSRQADVGDLAWGALGIVIGGGVACLRFKPPRGPHDPGASPQGPDDQPQA